MELRVAVISANIGNSQIRNTSHIETELPLNWLPENLQQGWTGLVDEDREESTVSFIRQKAGCTRKRELYINSRWVFRRKTRYAGTV